MSELQSIVERPALTIVGGHWAERAACLGADPGIWFSELAQPNRMARAICTDCPVRTDCLQHALDNDEDDYGIWGGLDPDQRRLRLRLMPE